MIANANILISGGGTGGHIFPAIAIANEIQRRYPSSNILFVGAKDKMEMEKVPDAGYKIVGLWISGFQRSLSFKNIVFPIKLIHSFFSARKVVQKFQPHIAIGTGGYASGPALNAALAYGAKILIQEQNSFPGITNRILGKKASKICVAYDGMEKYFPQKHLIKTGNPVRKNLFEPPIMDRSTAAKKYFENPGDKILLVVGGSLGSRTLNTCVQKSIKQLTESNIQVIWQTGSAMYASCKSFGENNPAVCIKDFITDMQSAYSAADIIISRAGAIAISELCLVCKPVILVPFPFAAEDHQTKNAQALVKENAAIHIADSEAEEKLILAAIQLFDDKNRREQLAAGIQKLGMFNATDAIVDEIEKILV